MTYNFKDIYGVEMDVSGLSLEEQFNYNLCDMCKYSGCDISERMAMHLNDIESGSNNPFPKPTEIKDGECTDFKHEFDDEEEEDFENYE